MFGVFGNSFTSQVTKRRLDPFCNPMLLLILLITEKKKKFVLFWWSLVTPPNLLYQRFSLSRSPVENQVVKEIMYNRKRPVHASFTVEINTDTRLLILQNSDK